MTVDQLLALAEKHDDEFIKFDRVESPRHSRPDLCAFLMLHGLVPAKRYMVSAAEHDEIFLDVDVDELATVIDEASVITLLRCGIRFGDDGLKMFA